MSTRPYAQALRQALQAMDPYWGERLKNPDPVAAVNADKELAHIKGTLNRALDELDQLALTETPDAPHARVQRPFHGVPPAHTLYAVGRHTIRLDLVAFMTWTRVSSGDIMLKVAMDGSGEVLWLTEEEGNTLMDALRPPILGASPGSEEDRDALVHGDQPPHWS